MSQENVELARRNGRCLLQWAGYVARPGPARTGERIAGVAPALSVLLPLVRVAAPSR
jgi:hypothetical protein